MKEFNFRSFTALSLFWSLVLETVSGIVLYIVPPGRIANWTNWKLWGLTKHEWGAVHTIFGYIFLVFAVIHLVYNWKPILFYIRKKVKAGLKMRLELTVSFVVALLILVATYAAVPPFGTIMDIGEDLKNSWEESRMEPFQPHAEDLSFKGFVDQINMAPEDARKILVQNGITITDELVLIKDIAAEFHASPSHIYDLLTRHTAAPGEKEGAHSSSTSLERKGRGYGWKTIAQVAQEEGILLGTAIDALASQGISARKNDVIRTLAEKNSKKATEIVNIIRSAKK